jgi:hypothetical protein
MEPESITEYPQVLLLTLWVSSLEQSKFHTKRTDCPTLLCSILQQYCLNLKMASMPPRYHGTERMLPNHCMPTKSRPPERPAQFRVPCPRKKKKETKTPVARDHATHQNMYCSRSSSLWSGVLNGLDRDRLCQAHPGTSSLRWRLWWCLLFLAVDVNLCCCRRERHPVSMFRDLG